MDDSELSRQVFEADQNKLLRLVKKTRERNETSTSAASKAQLANDSKKRIQTTMIGALASVEKHFGFMWEGDSEEEKLLRKVFRQLRNEILDKGNDQIKLMEQDLDQYQVVWNRYKYEFKA